MGRKRYTPEQIIRKLREVIRVIRGYPGTQYVLNDGCMASPTEGHADVGCRARYTTGTRHQAAQTW